MAALDTKTTSSMTSERRWTVPGKRAPKRKTREVLRLYFELRWGQRQITRTPTSATARCKAMSSDFGVALASFASPTARTLGRHLLQGLTITSLSRERQRSIRYEGRFSSIAGPCSKRLLTGIGHGHRQWTLSFQRFLDPELIFEEPGVERSCTPSARRKHHDLGVSIGAVVIHV
jgi:hypothetical protein